MPPTIDVLKLLHEGQAFEWGHIAVGPDRHAEVWVDLRPWLSQPELLKPLAWQLIRNMVPAHVHIDTLVAIQADALPLAYELAAQLKKPLNWLDADQRPLRPLQPGERVLLVTDVARTGETLRQAASQLGPCQLLGAAALVASSALNRLPFALHASLKLPLAQFAPDACPGCAEGHALKQKGL
jgi:orotate phosphoribosyltransferase